MKVLASLLPFLASAENEGESDGQEDCVMMIDVVNGEKLCVKNPEMGAMDDFFRYKITSVHYDSYRGLIFDEILEESESKQKGREIHQQRRNLNLKISNHPLQPILTTISVGFNSCLQIYNK